MLCLGGAVERRSGAGSEAGAYWCLARTIDKGREALSLAMITLDHSRTSHPVTARYQVAIPLSSVLIPPTPLYLSSLTPCPSSFFPYIISIFVSCMTHWYPTFWA